MIGMTIFAAMAAVTAAASVALRPSSRSSAMRRLAAMQGNPETPRLSRIGIAAVIAGACAILRGGGTPVEAFEEQMGRRFAVPGITPSRMRALLASRALPKETDRQTDQVANDIAVACNLSVMLGCPAVRCLEAVGETYRRSRLAEDLRSQVFAVPQATVRLLSALPLGTVMMGELLGSRPLAFILATAPGLMCLTLGSCCYVAGLMWMRAMLRDMG